jgi:organic radical activating enzyme
LLDQFTSNGSKFGHHSCSMQSYRINTHHSIISTHISPEGSCNLNCKYCSVHRRKPTRIKLKVIEKYVEDLLERGLKAVVLTGGGEPLLYPKIEDLLKFLFEKRLEVGIITNGTLFDKVSDELLKQCSWIRVSINRLDPSKGYSWVPSEEVRKSVTFGLSVLYDNDDALLKFAIDNREKVNAQYVRVVCNCLARGEKLEKKWKIAKDAVERLGDDRTFFQGRKHLSPIMSKCHLGHFRPYLSEIVHPETGEPGSVFACDSIPLHNSQGRFHTYWSLCPASRVLDYLDDDIEQEFMPVSDCNGCLFSEHNEMIQDFLHSGEFPERKQIGHPNFI